MPAARAIFQAHIDGLTATNLTPNSVPLTFAWSMEDSAGDLRIVDLATGTLMLTAPPKASMLCVEPPTTNVTPLFLVGATGDTGVALSPNTATVVPLALAANGTLLGPLGLRCATAIARVRLSWL
jgi:hypothetical protein